MTKPLPLRIFLATPGDCDMERRLVRACVASYNNERSAESHIEYEIVEYGQVRGTARRPQAAINELINECHLMLVIFKSSWGSDPGSPWQYSSGTEEELFTGLLDLGQAEAPMRDIWVAFMSTPAPTAEVTALRRQLELTHALLYEPIETADDLKENLTQRLVSWEPLALSKYPRLVDLLPSSGLDVLRAANHRVRGEKLLQLGADVLGTDELEKASEIGGPAEHLALARRLARIGEYPRALEKIQLAIEIVAVDPTGLYSQLAAEVFAAQAGVYRRQHRPFDAIGRLEHALTLLDEAEATAKPLFARILDDIGLAHQELSEIPEARSAFERALVLRRESVNTAEVAQSLINLSRLDVADGNPIGAKELADEALAALGGLPPTTVHANAYVLAAQVRLRVGKFEEGLHFAERALSINTQLSSTHGQAISLLLLAQCSRAAGRAEESRSYAQRCVALNESMGDRVGVDRATWILEQLDQGN